ncbi:MAG TPA: hypothetical protein VGP16_08565 [Asanoa sp.]|nr:hypothetical protein [Asanoa sp.]
MATTRPTRTDALHHRAGMIDETVHPYDHVESLVEQRSSWF